MGNKKKVDIFKSRTQEWDNDFYQGKRKDQIEFSEKAAAISLVVILVIIGMLFYIKIMN
jgi:hypothetical protein